MMDHKQGACIKMDEATIRARNDVTKVSIYCCETRMDYRGEWPCGEPRENQAMVVRLFACDQCKNHVKLMVPYKKYEVTKIGTNGEWTEGNLVEV